MRLRSHDARGGAPGLDEQQRLVGAPARIRGALEMRRVDVVVCPNSAAPWAVFIAVSPGCCFYPDESAKA